MNLEKEFFRENNIFEILKRVAFVLIYGWFRLTIEKNRSYCIIFSIFLEGMSYISSYQLLIQRFSELDTRI